MNKEEQNKKKHEERGRIEEASEENNVINAGKKIVEDIMTENFL